jgi:ParB-like chromosome segregation protein Spo0J
MSWRNYFTPHPSALAFNQYTTDEDRRAMEADLKEFRLHQPIVTASVPNEGKLYIIDGITRLDAMEALGWQIVNEKGEWMGALATKVGGRSMVDHRYGYTHKQIADLVISLNAQRRHQTKEQLAKAIAEAAKLEHATREKEFSAVEGEKLPSKRGRLGEGRPKDQVKAKVVEQAAKLGVSQRTAERALAKPQSAKKAAPSKPRKPKPEPTFEDQVWNRWSSWLKYYPLGSQQEKVKAWVHDWTKPKGGTP